MTLSPDQVAVRRTRVGSSDMGALLGVDPHWTALDVFRERVHGQQREETPEMVWGRYQEGAGLTYFQDSTGLRIVRPESTFVHPAADYLCATPDALAYDGDANVGDLKEVKNVGRWMLDGWEPEEEAIPLRVRAQVQIALDVTVALGIASTKGEVIAILAGEPPAFVPVDHDPDGCGVLRQLAEKFVRDCLIPGKEPKGWEKDRSALDYVKRRFKEHDESMKLPTAEAVTRARQLGVAKRRLARWKAVAEEAQARLCAEIGEAAGIQGVCTWKANKKGTRTLLPWNKEW